MFEDASIEDIRMMFDNTIVMYGGWPVRVLSCDTVDRVHVLNTRSLSTGADRTVPVTHKMFDFTPVSLGMVNSDKTCLFLARRALRRYKQGLSRESMLYKNITDPTDAFLNLRDAIRGLESKFLVNCIKGRYPSLPETLEMVNKGVESQAFNRVFAIDSEMNLYFKHNKVGMIDSDNGKIVLQPRKSYLKTLLED